MHRLSLLLIDLLLIIFATVSALILRDNLVFSFSRLLLLLPYLGLTLAVAVPILIVSGLNQSIWRLSAMPDYLRVVLAVLLIVIAAITLGFVVNRLEAVARSLPILQGILMVFALVGVRVLIRLRHIARVPKQTRFDGHGPAENILIVGLNRITELYLQSVAEFANDRIRIAGLLGQRERHAGRLVRQYKVLGIPDEVATIMRSLEVHGVLIDRIVVTTSFDRLSKAAQAALLDVERTSSTKLDFFAERVHLDPRSGCEDGKIASRNASTSGNGSIAFHTVDPGVLGSSGYWRAKRIMDFVVAACMLVVALPASLLVAMLVAIDIGLPTTFWQQRPGLGGRPFKLYKFRTMAAAHDAHGRRVPDHERLSIIGRFLRRTRLDELPQLYNILIGEMSFVGPRPLLPADQSPAFAARLLVRPGLTGWAQVVGGREISAADKAALDIWYVHNASFFLDLTIVARTLPMVLLGERVNIEAIHRAWRDLRQAGICSANPHGEVNDFISTSGPTGATEQAA